MLSDRAERIRAANPRGKHLLRWQSHKAAILKALAQEPARHGRLMEVCGFGKGHMTDLLARLTAEGLAENRHGIYWLTERGREAVAHAAADA